MAARREIGSVAFGDAVSGEIFYAGFSGVTMRLRYGRVTKVKKQGLVVVLAAVVSVLFHQYFFQQI